MLGLKSASWNFTTPGHGKSHADGVGGTVKSLCDRAVGQGRDVMNVNDIIKVVEDTKSKVTMFLVTEDDIKLNDTLLPKDLKAVPNSKSIFQMIWNNKKPETVFLNSLSCKDCLSSPPCTHFPLSPNQYTFPDLTQDALNIPTPPKINLDDWILFMQKSEKKKLWFIGTVKGISDKSFNVRVMSRTGKQFRWPRTEKIQSLSYEEIVSKIDNPPQKRNRSVFSFIDDEYKALMIELKKFKISVK